MAWALKLRGIELGIVDIHIIWALTQIYARSLHRPGRKEKLLIFTSGNDLSLFIYIFIALLQPTLPTSSIHQ